MNDAIISPWLVYLMGISENLGVIAIAVAVITGIAAIIISIITGVASGENNRCYFGWKTMGPVAVLVTIAFTSMLSFALIPEPKWIAAVIVANETTPANIEAVIEGGKDFKNEIKNDFMEVLEYITGEELVPDAIKEAAVEELID